MASPSSSDFFSTSRLLRACTASQYWLTTSSTASFNWLSKVACDCRTPRCAMMIGARLANRPNLRSNGCDSEKASPELNDGFTVAKLLFVVNRFEVNATLTPVPVWNSCEKPRFEFWPSVLSVEAPFKDDALGEVLRFAAKP